MSKVLSVVVTSATGVQGGHVARVLLERGHRVRAITRTPGSDAAKALAALRAELFEGTWEDGAAMHRAMRGMDALVLHTVPWWVGGPNEPALAEGVARAALEEKVPHTVFLSAAGAEHGSGFVVLDAKGRIEKILEEMRLPVTVLAPAFLMENFLAPLWFGGIADGRFPIPLPAERVLQMVSARDQAVLAVNILESGRNFVGKRIALASDALSCGQIADVLSAHCGRTVRHEYFPMAQVEAMNPSLPFLFRWLDSRGHQVDIPRVRSEFPQVVWRDFPTWCAAQDWRVLDVAPPPPAHDHDHEHSDH